MSLIEDYQPASGREQLQRYFRDRVVVVYLGGIMAQANCADLFAMPKHPYTRALLDAAGRVTNPDL